MNSSILQYGLSHLNGFSTNYFRLEPQNQSSGLTANSIIRTSLPNNSLVNLKSLKMFFNLKLNGAAAGARVGKASDIVERIELTSGGVSLNSGAIGFNTLVRAKEALMGDDKCSGVLNHKDIVREISYVDGSTIAGTNNETYPSANGQTQFCIDNWEGFIDSCEPSVLDLSLMPMLEISITLADNTVLTSSAGVTLKGATTGTGDTDFTDNGALGGTYELNNVSFSIETMGLQDDFYDNMVQATMSGSAGALELPFKQYFPFQDTTSSTMRFGVASGSIDRIWAVHHASGYDTVKAPVLVSGHKVFSATNTLGGICQFDAGGSLGYNKEKYLPAYFNYVEPPSATLPSFQYSINGAVLPNYRASTEQFLGISQNSIQGKMVSDVGLKTMKDNYSVSCIRLNLPHSESQRLVSGLNSRGITMSAYYNMYNLNAARTVSLFVECTSILRIGAQRQIEIIN